MKRHHKLSHQQENQTASEHHHSASQSAQEFANADEVLRYDAAQTDVPPDVARQLQKSLSSSPVKSSWWKNLFGK